MKTIVLTLALLHANVYLQGQVYVWKEFSNIHNFGSFSQHFQQASSFQDNPACLSRQMKLTFGAWYHYAYMLNELSAFSSYLLIPGKKSGFGIAASLQGKVPWQQSNYSISYGRLLSGEFELGIQFHYFQLKTAGYGKDRFVMPELAILMHPTSLLSIGISGQVPVKDKPLKYSGMRTPFVYTLGIGYELEKVALLELMLTKVGQEMVSCRFRCSYQAALQKILFTGINTRPFNFFLGSSIRISSVSLGLMVYYHPNLGLYPNSSIAWQKL
ncbi:hypothetical protein COR50_00750 [Chitinophaga caeni]|uniref:Type IX secretion system membrane protein PorP/SprF n=1 Tax=Chitinophaga caeni TaxID=2029983 RepID=A0A291QPN4_9BACT|nr:hypothetical protein [Chitinophaga caeni]ATL45804.1 hypothetical protein COR50_00750 [Chitinophaga caeni]